MSLNKQPTGKKKLSLLLPAHNEELIICETIKSAKKAGMSGKDIFVVDDASTDNTRDMALQLLPKSQVLSVEHSGKAPALKKAIVHFKIADKYQWLHVSDADSIFDKNYFRIYTKKLSSEFVAAVGFVQSMRGNWLAKYRCFSYTLGQHIYRRLQSWFGVIAVMPGPISCYRTDILKNLDFETGSLTEDFDITLQIHRNKYGKIAYIPEAISYTQDPRTINDFTKQTMRWNRGFFQGLKRYKIGLKTQRIDLCILVLLADALFFMFQLFVVIPLIFYYTHSFMAVITWLLIDYLVVMTLYIFSALATGRKYMLISLPYYYVIKTAELGMFLYAFSEIFIFNKHQTNVVGWETAGRRYAINQNKDEI